MEVSEQLKLLLKEQVKQQSSAGGISDLLQQVFKEAIQEMLQAEMDNHVGYEKHASDAHEHPNSRNVLQDLKRRGVQDILISSTDNLRGFTDAISTVYPHARTQICVVHQLRNSLKFVMWKDKKSVVEELKKIYNASDETSALHYLDSFEAIWSKKYPFIAKSWRANWQNLSTFYEFPGCIRKIIYTTNVIENINRIIRKYTKTKCSLPNDQAVEKVVYLALMQIARKWSQPQDDWATMLVNFIDIFGQQRCDVEV
jgi:putative transposase